MAVYQFDGIDTKHPKYEALSKKWQRVRHVMAGQDAVHDAGVLYLPKLKNEQRADYTARKQRTPFYNASWRTLAGLVGMIFNKEPTIKVPTAIEAYLEDVTMTGVPFNVFAKQVTFEMLGPTFGGILVDHPPKPEGNAPVTVKMAEEYGLRPLMTLYKAEAIINWHHRRIKNKWTLAQVRLMETVSEPDGDSEFKRKDVEQIRVLDLDQAAGDTYRQRLFRKDKATGKWELYGKPVIPLMNGQPLNYIPFELLPDGDPDEPVLIDLVDLNLKHYQVSADYEHGCHMTALPTPWVAGMTDKVDPETGKAIPNELSIGSTSAWVFPDHETKVGMLEFTGSGIAALKDNLAGKEAQMAAIGARMLAPEKKGVEAGETVAIRHSGENSVLADAAIALSISLTRVLAWFRDWAVVSGEVDCQLNRDFLPVRMDGATLTSLMGAWQAGGLSEEEFFELLKRGDVVRADKTLEEHQAEIEANPPVGKLTAEAGLEALNNPDDDDEE